MRLRDCAVGTLKEILRTRRSALPDIAKSFYHTGQKAGSIAETPDYLAK